MLMHSAHALLYYSAAAAAAPAPAAAAAATDVNLCQTEIVYAMYACSRIFFRSL